MLKLKVIIFMFSFIVVMCGYIVGVYATSNIYFNIGGVVSYEVPYIELEGFEFVQTSQTTGELVDYTGQEKNLTIPSSYSVVIENGKEIFIEGESYVVTSIGDGALARCNSLESVYIPNTITSIGEEVFDYSGSLESINVDSNNSFFSSSDGILFNKNKTILIRYPEDKSGSSYTIPLGVTQLSNGAFSNCDWLNYVTLSSTLQSVGDKPFAGCYLLINIEVPSSNNYYASIDGVLYNKNITSLVRYPIMRFGSYIIPSSVSTIEAYAFYACSNVTNISFEENSKLKYISEGGFYSCGAENIDFSNCQELYSLQNMAFGYCKYLVSLELPSSVSFINGAFFYNDSLKWIKLNSINPPSLYGVNLIADITIYVPNESLSVYQDSSWGSFELVGF